MKLFLRILFCICAVVCVGATFPLASIGGWVYAMLCIVGAGIFGVLMVLAKNNWHLHEQEEEKADFLNPKKRDQEEDHTQD